MREKLLAVCDKDERYLQGMQEYFQRKGTADFQIVIFTALEQIISYSQNKPIEILLIGENVYTEEAPNARAGKIYLLSENGHNGNAEYPAITKFQSMAGIFAQIMEEYAQDISCSGASVRNRKRTKLVSFYSPDRADAQTATALAAGQMLSNAGSKTLYLNLRAFAGFEELLHTEFEADVTDYFYFVLQYADKALYKLESMRKTLGELHYLPPALDYADLLQITEQQWEQAIDVLLDSGHYEVILLDLSEICQGFYSLLARSDKIVFLQGDSRQSQAMKMQYQKLLEARGAVKITDKTCYSTLPENWEKECCNYERLAATRLGELMKRELWDIRDRGAVNGEI